MATPKTESPQSQPAPAGKPKSRKQGYLPGTEPETIAEIEQAADSFRRLRDERMELTRDEVQAQENLLRVMKKHGRREYRYEDGSTRFLVEIVESAEKVKVKAEASGEAEE